MAFTRLTTYQQGSVVMDAALFGRSLDLATTFVVETIFSSTDTTWRIQGLGFAADLDAAPRAVPLFRPTAAPPVQVGLADVVGDAAPELVAAVGAPVFDAGSGLWRSRVDYYPLAPGQAPGVTGVHGKSDLPRSTETLLRLDLPAGGPFRLGQLDGLTIGEVYGRAADNLVHGYNQGPYAPTGPGDLLRGFRGDDSLYGQGGDDRMAGGEGRDLLDGGAGADSLWGGDGDDRLDGGGNRAGPAGFDMLDGGAGADDIVFGTTEGAGDRIRGFVTGEDRILVSGAAFGGLAAGTDLGATGRFAVAADGRPDAPHGTGQFVHEPDAGRLWWDADGQGGAARLLVAVLLGAPALAADDIVVIA